MTSEAERIAQVSSDIIRQFNAKLEEKLEEIAAAGIGIERIKIVTYQYCEECHGGYMVVKWPSFDEVRKQVNEYTVEISGCSKCPGIVIDWDKELTG